MSFITVQKKFFMDSCAHLTQKVGSAPLTIQISFVQLKLTIGIRVGLLLVPEERWVYLMLGRLNLPAD
jgi:hypothetical protein